MDAMSEVGRSRGIGAFGPRPFILLVPCMPSVDCALGYGATDVVVQGSRSVDPSLDKVISSIMRGIFLARRRIPLLPRWGFLTRW